MIERSTLERLGELLRETGYSSHLVLVGSAALYLAPTSVPPLTADADFLVDCASIGKDISGFLQQLKRVNFQRVADTATFVHAEGFSFDLLGFQPEPERDHIETLGDLSLLVFQDLCRLASQPLAIRLVQGLRVLSPAALTISKLLTWREEKGVKDKLQALALIGDLSGDASFLQELQTQLGALSEASWEDALADAQVAFLGLNPERLEEYGPFSPLIEKGFAILQGLRP